jgi:hypothetical protein
LNFKHPMIMFCIATLTLLGTMAVAQPSVSQTSVSQTPVSQTPMSQSTGENGAPVAETSALHSELPPVPGGKSTVMGGEIRDVDPVRDQFTLKVFGGRSIKVYFDDRTQIYRNGTKISVTELHPDEHASVETKLDGKAIFAVRIHMVSLVSEDEFRGRVTSYNAKSGKLTVDTNPAHQSLTVSVPAGTPVVTIGPDRTSTKQTGPPNFVPGSVINVRLKPGAVGKGVATGVDILAVPGSSFVFHGNLSLLNLHTGKLVILDPRDNQAYPIDFDSGRLPGARALHEGMSVRVVTTFDGVRYVASDIQVQ